MNKYAIEGIQQDSNLLKPSTNMAINEDVGYNTKDNNLPKTKSKWLWMEMYGISHKDNKLPKPPTNSTINKKIKI